MRIGYDAKRIFHNTTGLGNYGRDLVRIMADYYPGNEYFLYNPLPASVHRLKFRPNMKERLPSGSLAAFPALWRTKGILKDLVNDQIDVYHGLSGEIPVGISKKGIRSVVTVHDVIFLRHPEWYKPFDRWIYKKKFRRAVKEADVIVAVSEQTKKDILAYTSVNPDNIKVIYQGCHQVFKDKIPGEYLFQIHEKYGLPDEYILNVGTIERRKNAFSIVKAIKDLPYHLVLVGRETPYAKKIREFIDKHNMHQRVTFLSGLDLNELAAIYRMAKVFVYPSEYEGFGIPVIEALYSGIPVITNAKGVFPETAGPAGIYLENIHDTGEMREKIQYAMENDLSDRVAKGKAYVRKFDDDVIAAQWMEIYRKLTNGAD
jgi:glycosyltransferase involved in cell wall biosynthesis